MISTFSDIQRNDFNSIFFSLLRPISLQDSVLTVREAVKKCTKYMKHFGFINETHHGKPKQREKTRQQRRPANLPARSMTSIPLMGFPILRYHLLPQQIFFTHNWNLSRHCFVVVWLFVFCVVWFCLCLFLVLFLLLVLCVSVLVLGNVTRE